MIFGIAMLASPNHGVIVRALNRRKVRRHIDGEDVLKTVYQFLQTGNTCRTSDVAAQTRLAPAHVSASIKRLVGTNCLSVVGEVIGLTDTGRSRAVELVRAHRLWETYLAERAGIDDLGEIHDEAERLEHAHELADEVDATLGHPKRDPHGTVIPNA